MPNKILATKNKDIERLFCISMFCFICESIVGHLMPNKVLGSKKLFWQHLMPNKVLGSNTSLFIIRRASGLRACQIFQVLVYCYTGSFDMAGLRAQDPVGARAALPSRSRRAPVVLPRWTSRPLGPGYSDLVQTWPGISVDQWRQWVHQNEAPAEIYNSRWVPGANYRPKWWNMKGQ